MLAGRRSLSRPMVERSKAPMTVADERPHPEVGGQASRLSIVPFGSLDIGWIAVRSNLAEKAEGIGFVAALTAGPGVGEALPGVQLSVFDPVGEEVRFAEVHEQAWLQDVDLHRLVCGQRIAQQGKALGVVSPQGVHVPEIGGDECRRVRARPITRARGAPRTRE